MLAPFGPGELCVGAVQQRTAAAMLRSFGRSRRPAVFAGSCALAPKEGLGFHPAANWPKGYDLIEMAKHYPSFNETFSLTWFEQDSGPDEPVKNWSGTPVQEEDGGLRELDGVLGFRKR